LAGSDYWVRLAESACQDLPAASDYSARLGGSDCSVRWGCPDVELWERGLSCLSVGAVWQDHYQADSVRSDCWADYLDYSGRLASDCQAAADFAP